MRGIRDGLRATWLRLALMALLSQAAGVSATYYIDARGDDAADGRAPERAWRTLGRLREATVEPGDEVHFRRGGIFRGGLQPASGEPGRPVVYTAYGEGPKPILQGSVDRSRPEDWREERPGLWATQPAVYTPGELLDPLAANVWSLHTEGGAAAALTTAPGEAGRVAATVACRAAGTRSNHLQLWGPEVPGPLSDLMLLRLRWRCDQPFRASSLTILRTGSPYTAHAASPPDFAPVTAAWETIDVPLRLLTQGERPRVHLNLGGILPAGATFQIQLLGLYQATCNLTDLLSVDVGNIIFDHGVACGWKKWSVDALEQPGDYVYDGASQRVWLRSEGNPGTLHESLEFALKRHVIDQSGRHDVVYDGLHLRYGAAHGIGGGSTARITVRNCDIAYIGGAHQFTPEGGRPVRYGNGIEFWGAASDSLVERCRLWEIYDAALTNQGSGADSRQVKITYRDNVIWNAEYSFEYWNGPAQALTQDIVFEHNTCVDSGYVWSHAQRPDPNGAHLMFYRNLAPTTGFVVRDNVFGNSTEVCLRMDSDWRTGLAMDHNLWWQAEQPLVRWLVKTYFGLDELGAFRDATGLEFGAVEARPVFVDATARDYRLAEGSPGLAMASDGGRVGAR